MNLKAALLAREVADSFSTPSKLRFVVGSVGPTSRTCSISPDVEDPACRNVTFDQLAAAYCEQMTALIEGGVDALLCETIFDTLNAKAALYAADEAMEKTGREVPVMLSFTIADAQGRILSGQTIEYTDENMSITVREMDVQRIISAEITVFPKKEEEDEDEEKEKDEDADSESEE